MQRCVQSLDPVIKWSGSKRKIAPILSCFLPEAKRYLEPFVGSGAMLPFRPSEVGMAGDVIPELIQLWIAIRDEPELTIQEYSLRWQQLQNEGHIAYYKIRDSFNSTRNPYDFLFLSRTCVNGLIRFNKMVTSITHCIIPALGLRQNACRNSFISGALTFKTLRL